MLARNASRYGRDRGYLRDFRRKFWPRRELRVGFLSSRNCRWVLGVSHEAPHLDDACFGDVRDVTCRSSDADRSSTALGLEPAGRCYERIVAAANQTIDDSAACFRRR